MSEHDQLVSLLTAAQRVVVFAGAGVSTAAGIPDYRGPQGVWKTRQPVDFHDFMEDPEARLAYWVQKAEDWSRYGEATPTATHRALAQLEKLGKLTCLATQNVDGLDRLAGVTSEALVELHGCVREAECMQCGAREEAEPLYRKVLDEPAVPGCSACGDGFLKPATISFGQSLREADLLRVQEAIIQADLVLALGSSLSVQPAATFPLAAAQNGISYVVINQGPTAHDDHPLVHLRIEGDVQNIFPAAVEDASAMFG